LLMTEVHLYPLTCQPLEVVAAAVASLKTGAVGIAF